MNGYEPPRARFRRRVAEELRFMLQRTRALEDTDCFWVLELDRPRDKDAGVGTARRTRSRSRPRMLAIGEDHGQTGFFEPPQYLPAEDEPRGGRPRRNRFVQCLFEAHRPYFVIDLPECTLDPAEAEILLRERTGFFRAKDRPTLGYSPKTLAEHDPVCRQVLGGDEDDAALDVAYVLFDLYGLPVTTPLFQTAACFEGCSCWFERGVEFETLCWPRPVGSAGCPRCRGREKPA